MIRNIHTDFVQRAIVKGLAATCAELAIKVAAEGVEALEEVQVQRELDISFFQGYLFARPVEGADTASSSPSS